MTENNRNVVQECAYHVDKHFKNGFSALVVPPFTAPADGLLAGLYNTAAKVPKNPSKKTKKDLPCLLLHGLENPQHKTTDAYKFIEKTGDTCRGLYGTSGAGKTRSIFEYLSHNYGLYFVASIENDPGSDDLPRIMRKFYTYNSQNLLSDADSQNTKPRKSRSESNYHAMDRYISMMIYVRTVIFDAINKHVKLTPYQWLLIQLFPKEAMGVDLFSTVLQCCLTRAMENEDSSWDQAMESEYLQGTKKWPWTVMVVDEAQVLLDKLNDFFLSQDGERPRTAFSAVLRAMTHTVLNLGLEIGYPLVSGTGMSSQAINDATYSIMAKNPHYDETETIFDRFKPLDAVAVREYLLLFLTVDLDAPGNEGEVPNESALRHVCEWLRGRPRWAASFLELYLVRSHKEHYAGTRGRFSPLQGGRLIQALDRYLDNYTTDGTTGKKRSYNPPEGTAFSGITRVVDNNEWKNGVSLTSTLMGAIFKFAVGGQPSYIEKDYDTLIQVGVAALSHTNGKAVIDEPIVIEAGLNFFGLEQSALNNLMSQESTGLGEAFEKVLLPAIHRKFHDILEGQLGKKAAALKDYQVSYRSSYGVLARKCSTPQDTMEWINDATSSAFEGQVPPFCLPDVHIGPDLIFLLWDILYTTYVSVISQVKLRNDLNQMQASRTITPALLYYENRDSYKRKKKNCGRGQPKKKEALSMLITSDESLTASREAARPKLVGNEKGCVRFMVQYPCHKAQSAASGVLEDDKVEVLKEDKAGAPATKRRKKSDSRKLGWLVTIDKGTAKSFFDEKTMRYLNAAKDLDVPEEESEEE